MWNICIRISPKSAIDGTDRRQLKDVGWKFIDARDDTDTLTAIGNFSSVGELNSALQAAETASREIEPLTYEETLNLFSQRAFHIADPSDLIDRHPATRYDPSADGKSQAGSTAQAGTGGSNADDSLPKTVPEFSDTVWESMDAGTRSQAASSVVRSWLKYFTSRKAQAKWNGSRMSALMAQLNPNDRAAAASKLLESEVSMAKAIEVQFDAWTKLARKVPWLLLLTTVISALLVAACLYLVDRGRLDGWQLVFLIFVLALTAISPATLLLVGRPLAGLDKWTPDAIFGGGKEDKKDEGKAGDKEADKAADEGKDDKKPTPDKEPAAKVA